MALFLEVAGADNLIARVDFVDAAVLDVIQTLAKKADLDLVISGDMNFAQSKRTTLHLKNVTAEDAIDFVLRNNSLAYERKGQVILVSLLSQDQKLASYKGEIEALKLKYLYQAIVQ